MIISVLLLFNIITPEDALHGFANEQLAIILLLLVLSQILKKSSAIQSVFKKVLKPKDSPKLFLSKMMALVGFNSAFFNNTPIVAMMIPYVYDWSKSNNYSPSKFLIPLSYASILGGCVTLIGTSTTLIVNAIAQQCGVEGLGMFDLTPIGLLMLLIGSAYLYFYGYKVLPTNEIPQSYSSKEKVREYFMETIVNNDSPILGKNVVDAGLRNLNGLFLVEMLKGDTAIRPVSSETIIQAGDKLFFAGDLETISHLDFEDLGLSLPTNCETGTGRRQDLTEVVVSNSSFLTNRTIKQNNFRAKFDGAILAIHRNGERVWGKIGQVKLKAGDVLLVMAGVNFRNRIKESNDLYQISNIEFEEEPALNKIIPIFTGMIAAIVLAALGWFPLFNSLLILIFLSFVFGIAHLSDVKKSIDLNLIIVIGLGLALGVAMENSGASLIIADLLSLLSKQTNVVFFLCLLFVIVNILSAVITSKAAVAILIPVILKVTTVMELNSTAIVLLIAFSAAANFITPMGYQTNMMVYGPGRYSFKDFVKVGLPLTVIYMMVCVSILKMYYKLN